MRKDTRHPTGRQPGNLVLDGSRTTALPDRPENDPFPNRQKLKRISSIIGPGFRFFSVLGSEPPYFIHLDKIDPTLFEILAEERLAHIVSKPRHYSGARIDAAMGIAYVMFLANEMANGRPIACRRQLARLHILAPGDHVGAGHGAQLRRLCQPGEGREFTDIEFVGAPSLLVADVGQPFELGGTSERWSY